MNFFQTCIDFERKNEINKQELVLCEDFSIYNVFKALAGPGRKFLALCDLHHILTSHFEVHSSYDDFCLAIFRQGGSGQMRYTDYLGLVKPRNPDFSDYVNRRMNEVLIECDVTESFGMKDITRQRFGKLFQDMTLLENELEKQRKYKIQ
jgi:hypothetical protein